MRIPREKHILVRPTLVGRRAYHELTGPECKGMVIASFSKAIYFLLGEETLWLNLPGTAMHTRGVCVPSLGWSISFGVSVTLSEHGKAFFGDSYLLDLSGTPCWDSDPIDSLQISSPAVISETYYRVLVLAISQAEGGISPIIASPALVGEALMGTEISLECLAVPARAMARACMDGDWDSIAHWGRELVGLGPGLTPAGDDFLGGVLFILHHLHAVFPGIMVWNSTKVDELLTWAKDQTHPISYAVLHDLANGEGPEPLHTLVSLLLSSSDLETIRTCINRVRNIGHSSGGEMLSGVLTGMLWLVRRIDGAPFLGERGEDYVFGD